MKRVAAVVIAMMMGLSTLGFLPEAHAAARVHRKTEVKLLRMINRFRVNNGLDRLVEHSYIRREARRHSKAMSNRRFFSHAGFSGRVSRITRQDPGIDGGMCENIAFASGYSDFRKVAKVFYRGWRSSAGHRRCMSDKVVRGGTDSVGIGISRNGRTWHATYIAANDRTRGWTTADRN